MASASKIEWTDASWTPIGTGLPFKPGHRNDIELFLDEKILLAPLKWRKPRMIFVCSMTDLFADFVKDEWIDKVFAVMALCPQHTFQVLTKRAERMRAYFAKPHRANWASVVTKLLAECHFKKGDWSPVRATAAIWEAPALPNVWLGASCERQREANARIPHLLNTPAALRFVSCEPLLGPIDLTQIDGDPRWQPSRINALTGGRRVIDRGGSIGVPDKNGFPRLDWVICGGESGKDARPFHLEWADSIVAQCKSFNVACFVKQLGAVPLSSGYPLHLRDRKGGDASEWPDRLRIRQFPAGQGNAA